MRKFYKSTELQQRSPDWLTARMGRFTSSQISKLFASATIEETKAFAIEAFKTGKYNGKGLVPNFYTEQQITLAAKTLGFAGADLRAIKKQLKQEIVPSTASKVCDMVECLNDIVVFSSGALKYIGQKGGEFIFPNYEFGFQNEHMERGNDNEGFALETYFEVSGYEELDISFVTLGDAHASSPDRLFKTPEGQKGGVEVKCPTQENFVFAIENVLTEGDVKKYYEKYFFQCHHQIFICELDFVDLFFYHNDLKATPYQSYHGVRIHKEESIIKQFEKVLPVAVNLRNKKAKDLIRKRNYPFLKAV